MKYIQNISTTNRNNPQGLFFQLSIFALLSIMSLIGATATQTFAQTFSPAPVGLGASYAGNGNALDWLSRNNGIFAAGEIGQNFNPGGNGNRVLVAPTLGTYPPTTVAVGANATVTPSATPIGAASINVSTNSNFKGTFVANPTTGVVRVTNAHPAGSYTVDLIPNNSYKQNYRQFFEK